MAAGYSETLTSISQIAWWTPQMTVSAMFPRSLFTKQNFPVEKYTHNTTPKYAASTEYYRC